MTRFKYSFPLTPPVALPTAPEPRHEYPRPEFALTLPARWRQVEIPDDDTMNFASDVDEAAIVISVDFVELSDDETRAVAEHVLDGRIQALRADSAAEVQVLQRSVQPHRSGAGLTFSFIADAPGGHVHLHLGYVTARKVLNFAMVCRPGRPEAIALFNATVPGFRPRLP